MRDRAEQVGTHFLALTLHAELLLLLDLGGHRAGDERYAQHNEKRQRIAGHREVEFPVGEGEDVVDADNAQECSKRAEQISVCEARGEQHCENKYRRGEAVADVRAAQQGAEHQCTDKYRRENKEIPQRKRE